MADNIFQKKVYVVDQETGEGRWFEPGEECPDEFLPYVSEKLFQEEEPELPAGAEPGHNYAEMTKTELVELAKDRGISSSGTAAEIADRLVKHDESVGG